MPSRNQTSSFDWLPADMEIIVLLDGVDESTSRAIEVTAPGRVLFSSPMPEAPLPCLPAHSAAYPLHPTQPPLCCGLPPALQARHSYLPADIKWAHHFDPCIQRRWVGLGRRGPAPACIPGHAVLRSCCCARLLYAF